MVNPYRGEVALEIDGETHVLRLTLGALAELESDLGEDSLMALVERFEGGAFSARDLAALILAGLRGGGWHGDAQALMRAEIPGGPMGAARAAAQLLARAFVPPEAAGPVGDATGDTTGDAKGDATGVAR